MILRGLRLIGGSGRGVLALGKGDQVLGCEIEGVEIPLPAEYRRCVFIRCHRESNKINISDDRPVVAGCVLKDCVIKSKYFVGCMDLGGVSV